MMERIIRYRRAVRAGMACLIAAGALLAYYIAACIWYYLNLTPQNIGENQWMAALLALCMLGIGVMHIFALNALWQDVRIGGGPSFLRSIAISLGVVSAIMLFADTAALSDIGKQTLAGFGSPGEWLIVFCDCGIRALFLVLAGIALAQANRRVQGGIPGDDPMDTEFITVHEVGFVSAVLAVGAIALAFVLPVLAHLRAYVVWFFTAIAIAPWALMLLAWFVTRQKRADRWWDERQVSDMGRSALWTLPFVGLVLLALFVCQILIPQVMVQALWFPVFVVASVLGFSGLSAAFSRWG